MTILINLKQALKAVSFLKGIIFPDEDDKKWTLNLQLPPKVLFRITVSISKETSFLEKDIHEVKYPSCWGFDQLDMEKGTAKDLNLGNTKWINNHWIMTPAALPHHCTAFIQVSETGVANVAPSITINHEWCDSSGIYLISYCYCVPIWTPTNIYILSFGIYYWYTLAGCKLKYDNYNILHYTFQRVNTFQLWPFFTPQFNVG